MPPDAVNKPDAAQEITWQAIWLGLSSFGMVVVGAGLLVGLLYLLSPRLRRRLLPIQRLRWGRWSGGEVLLAFFLFRLSSDLVLGLLTRAKFFTAVYGEDPAPLRISFWVVAFTLPLSLVLVFTILYKLSETTADELGLSCNRWQANVTLGYLGFAVVTLPLLLLQAAIVWLDAAVAGQRVPHPFQELSKLDLAWWEQGLVLFAVSGAAPILEELMCRGLMLGWLRRASLLGQMVFMSALCTYSLFPTASVNDETPATNWGKFTFGMILLAGYTYLLQRLKQQNLFMMEIDFLPPGTNPLPITEASEDDRDETEDGEPEETQELREARDRWRAQDRLQQRHKVTLAIYGSAAVFALIHPTWPDPIPLFGLGLALGWLTHRTQSLLPAITLHALFNLVAFLVLMRS